MLLSWCLPCHRREDDLDKIWSRVRRACDASPPVEIVVVDYANEKPMQLDDWALASGNDMRVVRYRGREHYHMAHARNISIKAARGDYIVITSTDIAPNPGFFPTIRETLERTGAAWLRPDSFEFVGVIVVNREALIAAGGYDERFEFYGGEDRDLQQRLERRGLPCATYTSAGMLDMLRTRNAEKVANYRLPLTKTDMLKLGSEIRKENERNGVLVANEGQEWGVF